MSLSRRRNGKLQACEPCRKSKISCDHATPTCGRCKRKGVSSSCIYLDAPMTRTPEERRAEAKEGSWMFSPPTPTTGSSASPSSTLAVQDYSKPAAESSSGNSELKSAYFGPTAFSAIFSEHGGNISANDMQFSNDVEAEMPSNETFQSQTYLMFTGNGGRGCARVNTGVILLRSLPCQKTCEFLLKWYFENCHECVFHKPSIMEVARSMWETYGKQLRGPRRKDDLEKISITLCQNAKSAANEDFDDYGSWLESISGSNLRWESLGSIFGALTSALVALPHRDAFFCTQEDRRYNKKNFAMEMKDCLQACITLSNHMDYINIQMVALLAKNLILQTVLTGDTSLIVWRQLGDLVSASTALGLHRDVDRPVSFSSEMRRKIFGVVFNMDKESSFLTGRPPALSFRYCKFKLPLDLSEDDLGKVGENFKEAVERLDSDGWNTEGKVNLMTTTRAHLRFSITLNEILDFSLTDLEDRTNEKITYLLDRVDQTYKSFPASIRWNSDILHSTTVTDDVLFRVLNLRLQMLQQKLLLERLAYKQGFINGQSMIDCAREQLELTVLLWVQRDRFPERHHDYDWMLMCWGIPSAGVLCVQLLKETTGALNSDLLSLLQKEKEAGASPIRMPRSEIVQNLSLLIGFLEWVRPGAGNYKLCRRMRHVISNVLDQVLNPAPPKPTPSEEQPYEANQQHLEANQGAEAFDTTMWEPGNFGNDLDSLDLDWLNEIDWSKGPWIDLGGEDYPPVRFG